MHTHSEKRHEYTPGHWYASNEKSFLSSNIWAGVTAFMCSVIHAKDDLAPEAFEESVFFCCFCSSFSLTHCPCHLEGDRLLRSSSMLGCKTDLQIVSAQVPGGRNFSSLNVFATQLWSNSLSCIKSHHAPLWFSRPNKHQHLLQSNPTQPVREGRKLKEVYYLCKNIQVKTYQALQNQSKWVQNSQVVLNEVLLYIFSTFWISFRPIQTIN